MAAVGWRQFDDAGIYNTVRGVVNGGGAQSKKRFADTYTSISADGVLHLQILDICHCFFFLC